MTDTKYYTDYPTEKIGGGNPYWRCSHCKVSAPEINGSLEGHRKNCYYRLTKEAEMSLEDLKEEAHGATLQAPAVQVKVVPMDLTIPKTLKEANQASLVKVSVNDIVKDAERLYDKLSEDFSVLSFINDQDGGQSLGMHKIGYAQIKLKSIIEKLKEL